MAALLAGYRGALVWWFFSVRPFWPVVVDRAPLPSARQISGGTVTSNFHASRHNLGSVVYGLSRQPSLTRGVIQA